MSWSSTILIRSIPWKWYSPGIRRLKLTPCHDMVKSEYAQWNLKFPRPEFTHLTDVMIWWSPGMHSDIFPKKFHGRVQVFADLTHVIIRWSLGISKWNFDLSKSVYTSMDLRRDRKCSLKFREMHETQGYAQAQDAEEREAQSKRSVPLCWLVFTLVGWRKLS